MIAYDLTCEEGHRFEAWFKDAETFSFLSDRGDVVCPMCNSNGIHPTMAQDNKGIPADAEERLARLFEETRREMAAGEDDGELVVREATDEEAMEAMASLEEGDDEADAALRTRYPWGRRHDA